MKTVADYEKETSKNIYEVTLSKTVYVLAENQKQCDDIVSQDRSRWAMYHDAKIIKEKIQ